MRILRIRQALGFACALLSGSLLMGASHNGAWLHRVSAKDHARVSPLVHDEASRQMAAAGGAQLFRERCAQCHGKDAGGIGSRPELLNSRIAGATDGDLFWLLTNGNPWRGMPPWHMLPATERWQLVAYLHEINAKDEAADASEATQAATSSANSNTESMQSTGQKRNVK